MTISILVFFITVWVNYGVIKKDNETKMQSFKKSVKKSWDEHWIIFVLLAVGEMMFILGSSYVMFQIGEFIKSLQIK